MTHERAGCPFCEIAGKRRDAFFVYENQGAIAFLDVHPKAPGHTLVVPKEHSAIVGELPDQSLEFLAKAVKEAAKKLLPALKADGLTIGINQGEAGGQVVSHVHVHLIPRFRGDKGGSVQSVVATSSPPPAEVYGRICNYRQ